MTASAMAATITGGGSTLVAPLVSLWKNAYHGATIQYSSVGSGPGITGVSNGLYQFGASDAPMTATQANGCTKGAPGSCITIPWGLSATGIGYNVPGVGSGLHLTGTVLADIYLGQITKWNDPRIHKLNPGAHLPSLSITPVFRNGGSGDTYAFTNYLSSVNHTWAGQIGYATTVNFPTGVGKTGNSGVAAEVKATPGAIGYISGSYLISASVPTAQVQNAAGRFEYPNPNSIANAAKWVKNVPAGGVSIVNPPKKFKIAYPISTFTYAIVPQSPPSNAALIKSFLTFCVTTGRHFGYTLDFVAIPHVVQQAALAAIGRIH
jgi:phosphate transport system substrate-binding protein